MTARTASAARPASAPRRPPIARPDEAAASAGRFFDRYVLRPVGASVEAACWSRTVDGSVRLAVSTPQGPAIHVLLPAGTPVPEQHRDALEVIP